MSNLPKMTNKGKTHWLESVFRIVIPAGIIYGVVKLINAFAPILIQAIKNTWILIGLGAPLAFLLLYIVSNPKLIWMGYKSLCKKITSAFIKLDPLSFMDRYVDLLKGKLSSLEETRTTLKGKYIKLSRLTDEKMGLVRDYASKGKEALKQGNENLAGNFGELAATHKETVDIYTPILKKMESNIGFLDKLSENWSWSITKLETTIKAKREEYNTIKEMYKGISKAESLLRDTEEGKIYQMSLDALEESVTQKIAYIEQFEKDSKLIMQEIDIEKGVSRGEGLDLIKKYTDGKLLLTDKDFVMTKKIVTDVEFQEVSKNGKGNRFNLKMITILVLLSIGFTLPLSAQVKPYISVGASVSSKLPTYGAELGFYGSRVWVAALWESTFLKDNEYGGDFINYTGIRAYYKLSSYEDGLVDLYVNTAGKIGLKYADFVFEPGLSTVVSFTEHVGLQFNLSTPIYENTSVFKPIYLSGGLSLNYWF